MVRQDPDDLRKGSISLIEADSCAAESLEEKHFLLAVERGDIITVRKEISKAMKENHININCTDPLSRSALIIAIENEDSDLVFLLLNGGVKPKDALLHAIDEEYVEAVEILLEYEEEIHRKSKHRMPYSWELMKAEFAKWTPDVTPLILAGHKNNYEILKILLDRGAAIPIPHDIKCGCDLCITLSHEDSLKYSKARIHAYKALTSPCLISLSSRDPILTAFELSWELRKLARIENEFKEEYEELRDKVQQFSVDLLDHARSSTELDVMLNYDPDSHFEDFDEEEDEIERKMGLERLKIAIECRQKKFVSHPHVQQLLASLWYMHLAGFRRRSVFGQLTGALKVACSFPLYAMAYIIAPNSKIGKMSKLPFIKFLCHSASFMFFLFLLVLVSQRAEYMVIKLFGTEWMKEQLREKEKKERGGFLSYTELLIVWYVICYIWAELKELWDAGLMNYVKDLWNFADFASNTLYLTWISLRIMAWYIVHRELSQGIDAYIPREEWHAFDPMLVAEAMFGAANIFSFLKLINIFLISPQLGPLQISLGRMVFDIMKFFFFYTLVLFAYACGLNQILSYYADLDKQLCYSYEDEPYRMNRDDWELSCDIWRRFANLFETSQSLFWASFGLVDLNSFDLSGVKEFTRFWTLLMFGCYSIMNVVVLLNLLIAMMNHSFSIIADRADVEWKFARTKLWMKYFEDGGTVPPPFNTIPSIKSFKRLFCRKTQEIHHSTRIETVKKKEAKYKRTMRCLVRRYITAKQKATEDKGISEDDVNEVKNEINSFRYTLIDMLLKNGFKGETPEIGGTVAGKKQLTKERMLMKGFQIDVTEDAAIGHHLRGSRKKGNMLANIVMKATGKSVKKDWNKISRSKEQSNDQIGNTDRYVRRRTSVKRGTRMQSSLNKDNISEMSRQKTKIQKREAKLQHDKMEYKNATNWGRVAFMTKKGVFSGGSMKKELMKDIIPLVADNRGDEPVRVARNWEILSAMAKSGAFRSYRSFDMEDAPEDDGVVESKIKQYGRGGGEKFVITPEPPTSPDVQLTNASIEAEKSDDSADVERSDTSPEIPYSELQTSSEGGDLADSDLLINTTKSLDMDGPVTEFYDIASSSPVPPEPKKIPFVPKPSFPTPKKRPNQRRFSRQNEQKLQQQTSEDFEEDLIKFTPLPKVNPFRRPHMKSSGMAPIRGKIAAKQKPSGESKMGLHSKVHPQEISKTVEEESTSLSGLQPGMDHQSLSPVKSARQFLESENKVDQPVLTQNHVTSTKQQFIYTQVKGYADTMMSTTSSGTGTFVALPKKNPVARCVTDIDTEDYNQRSSRPQVIKKKKVQNTFNYQPWNPPEPLWRQTGQQTAETPQEDQVIQSGIKQVKELSREGSPASQAVEESFHAENSEKMAKKAQSIKKHRAPSPPQGGNSFFTPGWM